MSVANKYPELPEVPYRKTKVEMAAIVVYIRSLSVSLAIKIAAYIMFRNESANGTKGVNENYCGIQADNSRWPDYLSKKATSTCIIAENMTGKQRRFLCFSDFKASIDFLIDRVENRQLYVGGFPNKIFKQKINSREDWTLAYYREWVTGSSKAIIPNAEQKSLLSMYAQGLMLFGQS